eukprot:6082557-Ditylum_brightwellii.AAC.1
MASISSSKSSYKTYKRNMYNQEKLPSGLFESAKQIQIFKHDFKVAHRRSNWCQILKINTLKGVKDVITNFMLIEEDNLKGACIKRTPKKKVAMLNMLVALWKSFTQHVKMTMQTVANKHECNSPALLYHLLWHYNGTTESIIRTFQDLMNALPDKLDKLGFGIANFCNYATKTLKTLTDTGCTDKQAPLKLYEALEFSKLATMAKSKYASLKIRSQWDTTNKPTISKKHSADDIVALCAKLKKKDKIIKIF